jgi:hypothetical protein
MKISPMLALAAALCAQAPAHAQQAPATSEAVREALAKKEGDTYSTSVLKETLSAVDKQYSLIGKGKRQINYEMNYAYIGQEKINTDLSSGTATLFSIENNNSHTITNTVTFDYGLRNNLTGSVTVPLISRYSDTAGYSGVSHTLGDLGLNTRFQPFGAQRDEPSLTLTGGVRLATGTSPFKVDISKGLATGAGFNTFNLGANVTKIVDPVALFGSINLGYGLAARHLSQTLNGALLRQVKPGPSIGFGMGFAYALSYKITTSFSFQESISGGSTLTFDGGKRAKTSTQTGGVMSIGAGYRISPKTTVNVSVGIGLTAAAPNMSVTVGLPLAI